MSDTTPKPRSSTTPRCWSIIPPEHRDYRMHFWDKGEPKSDLTPAQKATVRPSRAGESHVI
jgi:hypothetical protein